MNAAVSALALPRVALPGQPDEDEDGGQAHAPESRQTMPQSPPPGLAARTADLVRSLSQLVSTTFQPPPIAPATGLAQEGGEDGDDDGDDAPPTPAADLSLAAAQQASCAASGSLPGKLLRTTSSKRAVRMMSDRVAVGGKGDIESGAAATMLPLEEDEEAQCPVSVGAGGERMLQSFLACD